MQEYFVDDFKVLVFLACVCVVCTLLGVVNCNARNIHFYTNCRVDCRRRVVECQPFSTRSSHVHDTSISHITWLERSNSPHKPQGYNFHPSKLVKTKTSKFHNVEEKKRNYFKKQNNTQEIIKIKKKKRILDSKIKI